MSLFRYFSITAVAGLVALLLLTGASPRGTHADEPRLDVRYWFNGEDDCPDLIDTFQNEPQIHQGNCDGGNWGSSGTPALLTLDDVYSQFLMAGDWNTDFCADVIAVKAGQLWLLPGNCEHDVQAAIRMPGDFSAYNYIVAPGLWDADSHPDLIARRSDDGSLWLFSGNGSAGYADPVQIGTRWDACDLILGVGDFNNDGHVDLGCRRTDDHLLYLYPGDGIGGFAGPPQVIGNSAALSDYDWILGGGDWLQGDALKCPDFAGWKKSDPTNITFFGGICADNAINTTQTLTVPNQIGWNFPFASDSARLLFWGDVDCSGAPADIGDAIDIERSIVQLPVTTPAGCPDITDPRTVNGDIVTWGDVDCSEELADIGDSIDIERSIVQLPVTKPDSCPTIGSPL